ncbi:MAG: carboxypeptidase-like regulatory domain-containing protein [Flavihumibacter sp.]
MRLLTTVIFVSLAIACSPSGDPPRLTRNLVGTIRCFDEFGNSLPEDLPGISVSLGNGSAGQATPTDGTGTYRFALVDSGQYTITVSKNGYGTMQQFGIQVNPHRDSINITQQLAPMSISRLSTTAISQFSAHCEPGGTIAFNLKITPAPTTNQTPRYFRVFLGKDSGVSFTHFDRFLPALPIESSEAGKLVYSNFLETFPAGSTVWMRVYGDAYLNNMYTDKLLDIPVFPCLNPVTLPAVSFIMQQALFLGHALIIITKKLNSLLYIADRVLKKAAYASSKER